MPVYLKDINYIASSNIIPFIMLISFIIGVIISFIETIVEHDLHYTSILGHIILNIKFIIMSFVLILVVVAIYPEPLYYYNTETVVLSTNKEETKDIDINSSSANNISFRVNGAYIIAYKDDSTHIIRNVDLPSYIIYEKITFKVNQKWYLRDDIIKDIESRVVYRVKEVNLVGR